MADVVLIDTAPLLEASDVFDILPMVDTLLLVVRSGRLTEPAGSRVAELVGRFQVPVSGVILLGAPAKRADAYGYGYGENRQSKKKAKRARRRADHRPRPAADRRASVDEPTISERPSARREPSTELEEVFPVDQPVGDELPAEGEDQGRAGRESRRTRRTSSSA